MEKIVAIFVACTIDLLVCQDLPFIEGQHVFPDTDVCKVAVVEIVNRETRYRQSSNHVRPVIMGKCKWWLDERHFKSMNISELIKNGQNIIL